MTRVLVVEDHELMRDLLVFGLSRVGLEVIGATDLSDAAVLAQAREHRPDVVLLDLHLGLGITSMGMIAPLAEARARVLMLTAASDDALLARCLESGAAGIFYKAQPLGELVELVHDAATGKTVMEPEARAQLLAALHQHRDARPPAPLAFNSLSSREGEVLAALMKGRTADEIAQSEYVSLATVRTHIRSILRKLGVNSQLAAVVLAQQAGWGRD